MWSMLVLLRSKVSVGLFLSGNLGGEPTVNGTENRMALATFCMLVTAGGKGVL